MNASTNQDGQPEMKNAYDQDFEAYRREFTKSVQEATGKIRAVIAEAQQTLATLFEQEGLEHLQLEVMRGADAPLAPMTGETVDHAFARAKEILKQPETIFAAIQTSLYTHQEDLQHEQEERLEEMHTQVASPPAATQPDSFALQTGLPSSGNPSQAFPTAPTVAPPGFFAPQTGLLPPSNPLEAVSADPIAASDFLMSQAMESLDAALGALFQSMSNHAGRLEKG